MVENRLKVRLDLVGFLMLRGLRGISEIKPVCVVWWIGDIGDIGGGVVR